MKPAVAPARLGMPHGIPLPNALSSVPGFTAWPSMYMLPAGLSSAITKCLRGQKTQRSEKFHPIDDWLKSVIHSLA